MTPTEPQTFTRVIDGVELHWSVRGAGTNIVVLHGLCDSERSWWPVMAELGLRHRVFGLDLPGCGLSGRPDASYTIDWQARLVAAWLDELGISECDVIGHSYGGGLAMWLLLYRAHTIRRLALVASGGLGRAVAPELRLAALPFVVERFGQACMGKVTALLLALNGRALTTEDRRRLLTFNNSPGTARAFARTVRDVISWRGQKRHFMDRARDAQVLPALALFWGDHDRIIPIEHGEALCSSIDGCTLHRFAGSGHFLHWERPEALARALLDYLERPHVRRATLRAA
jgi:pimeloyl-ACP methyl ester carboxylesterase